MAEPLVIVERQGATARLILNRPDRLNALTAPLLQALTQALDRLESDLSVRALLLTGAGRAFSAGQDLDEPGVMDAGDLPAALHHTLENNYHPAAMALRLHRCPVVVAINGIAAGAGCNLALAGDFVLASEEAGLLQAFARIGLIPDCGGTWLLPRLIGEARARQLAFLAEPLSARQAEAWGLINRAVPADRLLDEAQALAERLATGPTRAYQLMKRAFAESWSNGYSHQLGLEAELQRLAGASTDFAEGVAAFRAKRTPGFTGC